MRSGRVPRFDDAVARTAWPIELHDRSDGYVWEMFAADHVHYVPLRSMTPPAAHNLVAAGRCVDGDAAALSSVRVMGPCSAMGAAAAHALDLAAASGPDGSVHDIDLGRLRSRLAANLGDERLMFLTDDEKAMRDGAEGPAVAAAMDLLLRYGAALDASRLCDIRNVAGTMTQPSPVKARLVARGRLGQGVRGHQPGQRRRLRGAADGGADVPAAARVRRRRAWYRALPEGEHRAAGRAARPSTAARGEHPRHLHPVPGGQPARCAASTARGWSPPR